MAYAHAPHIHWPHVEVQRHLLLAVVVLGLALAALVATQIDFASDGGGGAVQTGQPATPGTTLDFREFYAGLASPRTPAGQTVACSAGAGLQCLLGSPR